MDVLRPQIVCVGKRCYRKNFQGESRTNTAEEESFDGNNYSV